jgi:hypothetical protein
VISVPKPHPLWQALPRSETCAKTNQERKFATDTVRQQGRFRVSGFGTLSTFDKAPAQKFQHFGNCIHRGFCIALRSAAQIHLCAGDRGVAGAWLEMSTTPCASATNSADDSHGSSVPSEEVSLDCDALVRLQAAGANHHRFICQNTLRRDFQSLCGRTPTADRTETNGEDHICL